MKNRYTSLDLIAANMNRDRATVNDTAKRLGLTVTKHKTKVASGAFRKVHCVANGGVHKLELALSHLRRRTRKNGIHSTNGVEPVAEAEPVEVPVAMKIGEKVKELKALGVCELHFSKDTIDYVYTESGHVRLLS